jgi:hypothetical protein
MVGVPGRGLEIYRAVEEEEPESQSPPKCLQKLVRRDLGIEFSGEIARVMGGQYSPPVPTTVANSAMA